MLRILPYSDGSPAAVRADSLELTSDRKRADIVRDLERRLLLHAEEVHTQSGRHAKVLQSWAGWARHVELDAPPPDPATARRTFETAVATFAPERAARLLPWPREVTT